MMSKKLLLVLAGVLVLLLAGAFQSSGTVAHSQAFTRAAAGASIQVADTDPACEGDLEQPDGQNCNVDDGEAFTRAAAGASIQVADTNPACEGDLEQPDGQNCNVDDG